MRMMSVMAIRRMSCNRGVEIAKNQESVFCFLNAKISIMKLRNKKKNPRMGMKKI
jgi:hypothetical protein